MLNSLLQSAGKSKATGDLSVKSPHSLNLSSLLLPSVDSLVSYPVMHSHNIAMLPEVYSKKKKKRKIV